MESKDTGQGSLPRKSHAGIGLPGGRRQVKMPDTVRSDAMPPRMNGGAGLPSSRRENREVSLPSAGVAQERVRPAEGGGLPAPAVNRVPVPSQGQGLPPRKDEVPVQERKPIDEVGPSEGSAQVSSGAVVSKGLPGFTRKTVEDKALPPRGVTPAPNTEKDTPVVREGSVPSGHRSRVEDVPVSTGGNGYSTPVSPSSREGSVEGSYGEGEGLPYVEPSSRRVSVASPEVSAEGASGYTDGYPQGSTRGGKREPVRQVSVKSPLAGAEEWDDEDIPDTHLGLNAEAPQPKKGKKKAKLALTKRDIEIITLCARYRFAYREQIQHYFQSENVRNRLTRLADEGLLRKDMVTQNQALWLPSQAGLDVADLDLTHIERGRYSATSIAHSIGLLNLGIEFEQGWENLLKEEEWPNFNRVDRHGNRLQGETVITEREITNSFNRLKGIAKGDARKTADTSNELSKLRNDALAEIPAPGKLPLEMREGMAGLFVSYFQNKSHTPDMVIARPRSQDGSSNHIAIELELNPKPIPDWIRILRSFKADPMFKSVIYFTHKRSIVNQLSEVNKKHVGLPPEQFKILKYTPRNDSIPFWG